MNGSPTCTAGRFSADSLVELRRRHRRAVDAVASGLGADVVHGVADAARASLDDRVVPGDAETEHVHERIAAVGLVEHHLAADGRNADAVPVSADAGDDARTGCGALRGSSSGPNRSESSSAIGRAPIVKMSRMMPPTPVAAPW